MRRALRWTMGLAFGLGVLLAALAAWLCQPWVSALPAQAQRADQARLERDVRALCAMAPRDVEHPQGVEQAAEWVKAELLSAGATVTEQSFEFQGRSWRNLVGTFGPQTGERIIVGAHYDARGVFPGADDDASGMAAALEVARMLGAKAPRVRVDVVGYALEEAGLIGSAAHAKELREANVAVRAMFSLEMLGFYTQAPSSQHYPAPGLSFLYPSEGNFLAVVGPFGEPGLVRRLKAGMLGAGLPIESMNTPQAVPGVGRSDHASFWKQGYPAVLITDTAFERNHAYHTAQDGPETLDYPKLTQAANAVLGAVRAIE